MKSVKEVSKISGVSVRTLHHYDSIGLLTPSAKTPSGYRLYSDEDIKKLQTILIFKELDFPLKVIKNIISLPTSKLKEALKEQVKLLESRKRRTEKLILLAENIINKEEDFMDFSAFDKSETEKYIAEAKERFGNTDEYKQSEQKAAGRTSTENALVASGLMSIFKKFGEIKEEEASGAAAKALVSELKDYISENYYNCTPEILLSLGQMYVNDERFLQNIDAVGGEGTAKFVGAAINFFV